MATEAMGITITVYGGFCWNKKLKKNELEEHQESVFP